MQGKFITYVLLILFQLFLIRINAQETVSTSGGNANGTGRSLTYSVGQLVFTTNIGINGSSAQGVQQPYEISVVIGIEDKKISLLLDVFPNPTTNYLILDIGSLIENSKQKIHYQLLDANGKLLEDKEIYSSLSKIGMSELPSAIYYVKVIVENHEIKTFKIIKNQ